MASQAGPEAEEVGCVLGSWRKARHKEEAPGEDKNLQHGKLLHDGSKFERLEDEWTRLRWREVLMSVPNRRLAGLCRTVSDCETREAKRQAKRDKRWNRPAHDKRRVFSMYCIMMSGEWKGERFFHPSIQKHASMCEGNLLVRQYSTPFSNQAGTRPLLLIQRVTRNTSPTPKQQYGWAASVAL
ncbi:predicted protein [Histoplasma mississippiense (nom. inval.)]|uniref:predicted protein n=1 Tax=Ajellomyces capsulatus (strain NAm1 / WU24) TaxID=2059318 RepID=UPI000157C70C|nr:predicted protein [Histoplasma mississippiense (nom. inval.)]EDN08861.1 predicted protein [Histoplasma mississippiense (nom. inval.)]